MTPGKTAADFIRRKVTDVPKEGYIKLHRKILDWEWYSDRNVRDLFFHLLLSCTFAPVSHKGVSLAPGQLITSLGKLSEGTGLSIQQTRTALSKLQSTGEITVEITNRYSIITVNAWGLYQDTAAAAAYAGTDTASPCPQTVPEKSTEYQQQNNKDNNINNNNYLLSVSGQVRPAFEEFSRVRSEKGRPLTDTSAALIIRRLEEYSGGNESLQIKMLLASAEHGWTSVYPPKETGGAKTAGRKKSSPSSFSIDEINERAQLLPVYGR